MKKLYLMCVEVEFYVLAESEEDAEEWAETVQNWMDETPTRVIANRPVGAKQIDRKWLDAYPYNSDPDDPERSDWTVRQILEDEDEEVARAARAAAEAKCQSGTGRDSRRGRGRDRRCRSGRREDGRMKAEEARSGM